MKEENNHLIYISIDCESTGIAIENVDILEIGAIIDCIPASGKKEDLIPLENLPIFHAYFLPPDGIFKGEPQGLAMNANILQTIADKNKIIKEDNSKKDLFIHPQKLGSKFKNWMLNSEFYFKAEKDNAFTFVAGKNFDKFDRQLLGAKTDLFKHVVFRGAAIDPGVLLLKPGMTRMPGLDDCKKICGVDGEVTHYALDDAFDVIECLRHHYTK